MYPGDAVTPEEINELRNEGYILVEKPITKIDKNADDGTTRATIKGQVDGQDIEGFAMVSDSQARAAQTDVLTHSGQIATAHYLHGLAVALELIK
jgi:hypothetical protein